MSAEVEVGATYKVFSTRKGTFFGVVTRADEEWVTLTITEGKAKSMLEYNEREAGEEVTVRKSLTTFTPVQPAITQAEGGAP